MMYQIVSILFLLGVSWSYDQPEYGAWGPWGSPSKSCGTGSVYVFRYRQCLNNFCAKKDLVEKKLYALTLCPINGGWSDWSDWSEPSVSCSQQVGETFQVTQTRECNNPMPSNNGLPCQGPSEQTKEITLPACPQPIIDGNWSEWSQWSRVSKSCCASGSTETVTRTRTCDNPRPSSDGSSCQGSDRETKTVLIPKCAINGGWGEWTLWTTPSVTCSDNVVMVTRHRDCNRPTPSSGGLPCQGDSDESKIADIHSCPQPIIDGNWSEWSQWSRVSKSCCANGATETVTRTRTCDNPRPSSDGSSCQGSDRETKSVQIPKCAVNGGWGEWTLWNTPSVTCSDNVIMMTRHRDCNRPLPSNGGLPCQGDSDEFKNSDLSPCPAPIVDGGWSQWSEFSAPGKSCSDTPVQVFRTRLCNSPTPDINGAACVGADTESKFVTLPKCMKYSSVTKSYGAQRVDGVWGQWSDFSVPSVSCYFGTNSIIVFRTRTCFFAPNVPHGNDCVGESRQTKTADLPMCPAPITEEWSTWSSWSVAQSCSASGKTVIERTRTCVVSSGEGDATGNCVGEDIERKTITVPFCDKYGSKVSSYGATAVWGPWSDWSVSSVTCLHDGETVYLERTRKCLLNGAVVNNNKNCVGLDKETKLAELPSCPAPIVDGTWSSWSSWSQPTMSCSTSGLAQVSRTRTCIFDSAAMQGANCVGEAMEVKTVSVKLCYSSYQPQTVDGMWGSWSSWSTPSVTCYVTDPIVVTRTRTCVFVPNKPKGNMCVGSSSETKEASLPQCVAAILDGVWGDWSDWSAQTETCSRLGHTTVFRTRVCMRPSDNMEFNPCVGSDREEKQITVPLCAHQGVWEDWSAFGSPTISCSDNRQTIVTRSRKCRFVHDSDELIPCVGLAMEGKLVLLPRCSAAIIVTPGYQTAGYQAKTQGYQVYQAKTTPAAIIETTVYQGYKNPAYQAKTTPAAIQDTTVYQGYKLPSYKTTPAAIEDTTVASYHESTYEPEYE